MRLANSTMLRYYVLLLVSYLLGSIPFSFVIAITNGINLREVGSRNIGATNIARVGSGKLAAIALFLDTLKGFAAVYIGQKLFYDKSLYVCISAILVIIGHMFPIWLKFNGGKGVATTLGVLIAFSVHIALIFVFLWLIVFFIFRYSSLASLTSIIGSLVVAPLLQEDLFFTLLTIALLVFLRHKRNIANLIRNREYKFFR